LEESTIMTDYAINPDLRLIALIAGRARREKKNYCYPGQPWLCSHLGAWYGRAMSRRTVNRHLGALVRDNWIRRVRRHRVEKGRGLTFHSTLYFLGRRAVRWLASLAGHRPGDGKNRSKSATTTRVPSLAQHLPLRGRIIAGPPTPGGTGLKKKDTIPKFISAARRLLK
jgi:hypothetical protein